LETIDLAEKLALITEQWRPTHFSREPVTQSSGSSFTIDAPSLLPTQNVTGVVRLST
jgi:hypothetical protein